MPHEVSGKNEIPLQELGGTLQKLLQAAEAARWDELASITDEAQHVFDAYIANAAQTPPSVNRKTQLAETLASCERLKLLCQERKGQIAPLLEKLALATKHSD